MVYHVTSAAPPPTSIWSLVLIPEGDRVPLVLQKSEALIDIVSVAGPYSTHELLLVFCQQPDILMIDNFLTESFFWLR